MFHFGKWLALAAIFLVASSLPAIDVPPLTGRVVDMADVIGRSDKAELEKRIAEFEKATGGQMLVVTIKTLDGESIKNFSSRVAEKWKMEQMDGNKSILFVAAIKNRQSLVNVGGGWTNVIDDTKSEAVSREVTDFFLRRDYSGGLDYFVAKTREFITGTPSDVPPVSHEPPFWVIVLLLIPITLLVILYLLLCRGHTYGSGGSFFGEILGGLFSGGGGFFGGGGASGDW